MVRRKISNESLERWFDVDSVALSLMGEGTARGGVQISQIVEVETRDLWTTAIMSVCRVLVVPIAIQKKAKRQKVLPVQF